MSHTDAGNTTLGIGKKQKKHGRLLFLRRTTTIWCRTISEFRFVLISWWLCALNSPPYTFMEGRAKWGGAYIFRLESKSPLAKVIHWKFTALPRGFFSLWNLFIFLDFVPSINTRESPYNSLLFVCRMLSIPWSTKCVHRGGAPLPKCVILNLRRRDVWPRTRYFGTPLTQKLSFLTLPGLVLSGLGI